MRKKGNPMSKISPFLWYDKEAEQAAHFYVSLLPDSRIDGVARLPVDTPSGPAESVAVVDFTLAGESYVAFNGGKMDSFNHAVSFLIKCDSQAEIDRLWDAHLKNGGQEQQCGWLKDKWGLYWQVAPNVLFDMMRSPDRAASARAMQAMMKMIKLDIAALERAFKDS
jgi:predicted 3-demethylubiquinone-9 3-methyltransferase (glyoxalase superfamily)